jgi:ferredoxin
MPKVIYDSKECIGAGECEIFGSKYWKVHRNGKAELLGATHLGNGIFELEFDDADLSVMEKCARYCPTRCIVVRKVAKPLKSD